MKQPLFLISFILILLASCQPAADEQAIPEDLDGLKALLKKERAEMKVMQGRIDMLETKIDSLDPKPDKRKLVVADQLVRQDFKRYATLQGIVTSDDIVNASSETGGRLTSMTVKEGQYVKKGQLIATVDMESVKKSIAELETSLDLAKNVYERQSRLWKQNIGSEIQYLQAKNNKERIEKSLETVRFQLTKANVYAPISGVVDREFLMSGEMSSPGAPIVQILNTYNVKVQADLPETYLSKIKRGQYVDVYFPALEEERKARITLIGRSIDPANRTFKIEIKTNNSKGTLKPNLLAEVKINDYEEKDVFIVPQELIQQEIGGKEFLYKVEDSAEGKLAKKLYISTGESYDGSVIVNEGLTGEEQIIFDGARTVADGELIEISPKTVSDEQGK